MRKYRLLLIALALLMPWTTKAQNSTLTTCNGTANHQYVPFYGYYADDDQHNQMIYPADSLTVMNGDAILQMVFYIDQTAANGSNTSADRMGTWTVSLGETTATTLSGLDATTTLTEVYEGYFDCSTGQLTLLFETPYVYNGGNLLVDLQHEAAGYNSWYFLGVSATGASYCYSAQRDFLPKVQFTYGTPPTCFRVQSIAASDIVSDGMTISWVDTENSNTTYTLTYTAVGSTDTTEINGISGTSYILSGLDAATAYEIGVTPECSDNVMPRTGTYMTDCEDGSCMVTINAVDTYGDGWNGNAINVLQSGVLKGTATIASGNSATVQVAVCKGAPVTLTFTLGNFASEMSGTVTDGGGAVIFTIENMGSYASGATLATVSEACPDCLAPMALTDSLDENGNVVLSWSSDATSFMVYAGDSLYSDMVSDTFYVFTGLAASSVHQLGVAALCDAGDTSAITRHTVTTPCGVISSMPWSTGFENDETYSSPMCWTVLRSTEGYSASYPYVYNYTYHSGNRSLSFSTQYDDDTNMVVTSPIVYNPANLHVKFWANLSMDAGSTFEAGLMGDTNDMSSFVPLWSMNNSNPSYTEYTYTEYEFFTDLTDFEEGDTAYLAFRMVGSATGMYNDYVYIDDISMNSIPSCRMPMAGSGVVSNVSYGSADFAWDGNSESGYDLMLVHYNYDAAGNLTDTVVSHVFSDSTSITVDTLVENTTYYASVATICNESGEADTTDYLSLGSFTTQLRCYPVYQASLDAVANNAAIISWSHRNNMGIDGTGAIVTLTDLSNPTAAPTTQTVTGSTTMTFAGLVPGHSYSVTLTNLCGDTDTAAMQTIYFTTHAPECMQMYTDAQVGTNYTSSTPIYGYMEYGYSQTIYRDTLLAGLDTLTGMAYNSYFYNDEYKGVNNYEVDVYIGMIDTSSLTLFNNDYWMTTNLPVDSTMTKVATGSKMTVTGNGWYYLPFDTPYLVPAQNDGKRLIVTVVSHTLSIENNANNWRAAYDYTYDANYNYYYKGRYYYGTSPIDPTSTTSYSSSYAPNIRFYGNCDGGCVAPTANVTGSTGTSLDVQWLSNGSETSWKVEYKLPTATDWTLATTTTASMYTINGLTGGTMYVVRVGAVCDDTVVYSTEINGFTSCVGVIPPYSVVFTAANPCWSTNAGSPNSTNGYNIYSTYYLISPEIGVSLDTLSITFTDRCYGTSSTNQRYKVSACDADGSNKVQLASIAATEGAAFGTHTIYLAGYTGSQNHIIIERDPAGGDVYIKQVEINYLPACMPALNVVQDTATPSGMTLSWTAASANNGFTVNYRMAGTMDAWSNATTMTNSVTLNGLAASSNYEVEVVTNCTDGTTMSTGVLLFSTACVPVTTPYYVPTFYSMPACWNATYTGHPSITWGESVSQGAGYLLSSAGGTSTPINDWLITPAIVIPTTAQADSVMLVYQVAGAPDSYSSNSIARYELLVSTNGGTAPADFTDTLIIDTMNNNTFTYRRFAMSQYAGDTVIFAFHSTCANYGQVGMYDFGVRSVMQPLYYIEGNATVFTGDTNVYNAVHVEGDLGSMTYSWTSSMAAAGQATVLDGNTDAASIIYTAAGTDTIMFVATNAYGSDTSRGLVYVYNCVPISSFPYTEPFEVDNPCWLPVYADGDPTINTMMVTNEISSNMSLNTPHGGSKVFRFSSYSSKNDYNQYLISPELNGTDMTLSFWGARYGTGDHLWVGFSSTTRDTGAFVWDTAEVALSSSEWTEFTYTLPAGTKYVAFHYYGDYTFYVYLDDLTINGTSACSTPDITGVSAEETTVTVNYVSESDDVEVAIVAGAWTAHASGTLVANDTTYTFTGLTAETQYTVGVRAVCGVNSYSEWDTISVTTLQHPCLTPTGVTVSANTYDGATVIWTPGENETEWEVNVSCVSPVFNQTYSVSGTAQYVVTGLDEGVTYQVAVRGVCATGYYSDWSDTVDLATRSCDVIENVHETEVTSNSISLTWTATGATTYEVDYGDQGHVSGNGQSVTTTTNSITLNGLESESTYDIYVRQLCTETLTSQWSAMLRVTTDHVGIADVQNAKVTLFPNPASQMVTIDGIEGEATVSVVDMNGREVFNTNANETLTIDLTGYAKGAYFVRITGERTQAIRKLIVK